MKDQLEDGKKDDCQPDPGHPEYRAIHPWIIMMGQEVAEPGHKLFHVAPAEEGQNNSQDCGKPAHGRKNNRKSGHRAIGKSSHRKSKSKDLLAANPREKRESEDWVSG